MLVLSLFPGIGLLDMAFEEEGFCVVRGPDLLWGGDVRRFHPPAGKFDGVIGGPPCQMFSRLRFIQPLAGMKQGNLIPEFERVVGEAAPDWFLMENVEEAPEPDVSGYIVKSFVFNNRWTGAEQHRERRFSFGTRDGRALTPYIEFAALEAPLESVAVTASAGSVKLGGKVKRRFRPPTVIAGHGNAPGQRDTERTMTLERACELQGLPADFTADMPFTTHGKRKVVGNGVPLPMGRAIARAVKRALGLRNAEGAEPRSGGEESDASGLRPSGEPGAR